MSREAYFVCFVFLGGASLILLHLIRNRLRTYYPGLYSKLGRPTFLDSNLGPTYWNFHIFIWWRYRSEVRDPALWSLCILATACQLGVLALFFLVL